MINFSYSLFRMFTLSITHILTQPYKFSTQAIFSFSHPPLDPFSIFVFLLWLGNASYCRGWPCDMSHPLSTCWLQDVVLGAMKEPKCTKYIIWLFKELKSIQADEGTSNHSIAHEQTTRSIINSAMSKQERNLLKCVPLGVIALSRGEWSRGQDSHLPVQTGPAQALVIACQSRYSGL